MMARKNVKSIENKELDMEPNVAENVVDVPVAEVPVVEPEPEPFVAVPVEEPAIDKQAMLKDYEKYFEEVMKWTGEEIERCNDYIFASRSTDQKYMAYRQELYEYRYNVRRVKFHPFFPDLNRIKLPVPPNKVVEV